MYWEGGIQESGHLCQNRKRAALNWTGSGHIGFLGAELSRMKIFRVGINRISITELETSPVIGSISCSVIGWLQGCSKNHKDIYINLLRGTGENRLMELGVRELGTSHMLLHTVWPDLHKPREHDHPPFFLIRGPTHRQEAVPQCHYPKAIDGMNSPNTGVCWFSCPGVGWPLCTRTGWISPPVLVRGRVCLLGSVLGANVFFHWPFSPTHMLSL